MPQRTDSDVQVHFPKEGSESARRSGAVRRTWLRLLCLLVLGLPETSPGFWKPATLPSVDRRLQVQTPSDRVTAPTPIQEAAEQTLRTRLPSVRMERHPLYQTPVHVRCLEGCLTGVQGTGHGIALQSLDAVPPTESHRPIKVFLQQEAALYGYGPEVLTTQEPSREIVSAKNGLRSTTWEQRLDGIGVFEAVLVGHVTAADELLAISSTFVPNVEALATTSVPDRDQLLHQPPLDPVEAIALAAEAIQEPVNRNDIEALDPEPQGTDQRQEFRAPPLRGTISLRLTWLALGRDELALCWRVELTRRQGGERYQVLLDVRSGEILIQRCLTLYIQDATYQVFTSDSPSPFSPGLCTHSDFQPPLGPRQWVTLAAQSTNASPLGWISAGENETRGNNVDAHLDINADDFPDLPRPQGRPFRVFAPSLDLSQPAEENQEAGVVQLFYWCNRMHDALYDLGFDEAAGNYQKDNFGRGGIGGDPILADAQDGSGVNNANFTPSPDGEPGRIQMFVFDGAEPSRDGDLDAEIILHEYTHGLSTRLVGGGVGLTTLQAGGMGEGWSDFYALALLSESSDDPDACYAMGGYVTQGFFGLEQNYYYGIRRYPYSTDLTKNPLTFRDIDPTQISQHEGIPRNPVFPFSRGLASEVHNQGEVWCVTLWDARSLLIKKHGFESGNRLMLQLVTDGMKLSPPNPDFLQARDAILQADLINNRGANQSELWKAFARRGMGFSAESPVSSTTTGVKEAFDLPDSLGISGPRVLVYTGQHDGPFFTDCRTLTLTNHGDTPLQWVAGAERPEFQLRPASGTLAPRSSITLEACLTDAATQLAGGRYLDHLSITNVSSGVVQRRTLDIRVLQFAAMPFVDDFEGNALRPEWLVSKPDHGRVELTALGGPHGGKAHLLLDSDSDGLPARNEVTLAINLEGWTNVVLKFWAREFNDEPNPPPAGLFPDGADFDGVAISVDGSSWVEIQGLRQLTGTNQLFEVALDPVVAGYGLHYGDRFQIRFNQFDNYPVPLDGLAIDDVSVVGTPYRRFHLELPETVQEGSPSPELGAVVLGAPATEDVVFAMFAEPPEELGVSLATIIRRGETRGEFKLQAANNSKLDGTRRVQVRAVGQNYVGDAAELSIQDDEIAELTLAVPKQVIEGEGRLARAGRVTMNQKADNQLRISLRSSNPKKLSVPSSVTIPAGESEGRFDLTVLDGTEIEGPIQVEILAEVKGWRNSVAGVVITDNDSPTLALELPPAMSEGNPPTSAVVILGGTVRSNVVVTLGSSKPDQLSVPLRVTVEAGKLSASFDLSVLDDTRVEGVEIVTVAAEAPRFSSAAQPTTLLDDETPPALYDPSPRDGSTNQPPRLTLRWKPGFGDILVNGDFETGDLDGWHTASESGQGFVVNNGEVNPDGPDTPAPPYEGDFGALLAQDGPGIHVMWQDVSIPADAKSALLSWFDFIHNHGTEYFDPSQQYRVEIQDEEGKVLKVAFTTQPGDDLSTDWTRHEFDLTQFRGKTIRIMFAERDSLGFINVGVDNVRLELGTTGVTDFDVYLGKVPFFSEADRLGRVTTNSIFLTNLPPLQKLYWQVAAVRGEARTLSPIWSFETRSIGELNRFGWGAVPAHSRFGEPIPVQLTAQDEFGLTVTNFEGQVEFRCAAGPQTVDTVLITEIDPGRDDQVEFTNVTPGPVDISGWQVTFYDLNRWPNPKQVLTVPINTILPRDRTFSVREGGRAPGTFPDFRMGTNINWGFLSVGQPVAVMIRDSAGSLVDFATAVDGDPTLIQLPLPLPPEAWTGSPLPPITSQSNTWQRVGNRNHRSGQDWTIAPRTFNALNPALELPFEPAVRVATRPDRFIQFTNGSWSGTLSVEGVGKSMVLWAFDQSGHAGRSGEFSVAHPHDLALEGISKPASVFLDQTFPLSYSVTNSGDLAFDDVVWSAAIPPGLQVIDSHSSRGECEVTATGIQCRVGQLSGRSAVGITVRLQAAQSGSYELTSSVTSSSPESLLVNNQLSTRFDANLPLLVISDASVAEGDTGTNFAQFRVRLSAPIRRTVTVHYQTEDDGATAGQDYLATSGILSFPPGTTNQTIRVPVLGDTFYEVQERFLVRLDSPVEALLGDPEARCSIAEEELEPRLEVEDVTWAEGSTGENRSAEVPIRLTGKMSRDVAVTYFTADASAHRVGDYLAQRGQVVFRAGETQHWVNVPIVGDSKPEATKSFLMILTNSIGTDIGKREGVVTILDDDSKQLNSLAWSALARTQQVQVPFPVTLTALDGEGNVFRDFDGPVQLKGILSRRESGPAGGSNVWGFPLRTYFHDARSQFLYLPEELGAGGMIRGLKFWVESTPGQTLENFTVRIQSTPLREFQRQEWEPLDWQVVVRKDLLVSDPGELLVRFDTPFQYDGSRSVVVDISFDNHSYSEDGFCRSLETQSPRGRVFESDSAFGTPLEWKDLTPPASLVKRIPETQFIIDQEVPITPLVTGRFVDGRWSGEIAVLGLAEGMILEASAASGLVASSEVLSVVREIRPPHGPQLVGIHIRGLDVVVEFLGEPDQLYQLESTDRLVPALWAPVGSRVGGSHTGAFVIEADGAQHPRRFYRVRQLP